MGAITTAVTRDLDADVTFVDVRGRLTLGATVALRSVLLKCVAECPTAVVVDLSGCVADTLAALTVFPAVALHQAPQPVAVLVCGGDSIRRPRARTMLGPVPAYASRAEALRAVQDVRANQQRLELRLSPTLNAPDKARTAVADACDRWGLPDLVASATLVTSELVTNAVLHARTDVIVDASLRGTDVHLRVRDGSDVPPAMSDEPLDPIRDNGRGLPIVAFHSVAWGYVPASDGKVVWATLRAQPLGGAASGRG